MSLTDTQSILLSGAAQRCSGSIYPLPASITAGPGPVARTLNLLAKRGLVEERETSTPDEVARVEDMTRYGMFVTPAGLAAIGIEAPTPEGGDAGTSVAAASQTKAATVVALLSRREGATLPELITATGWLPHTTRAFLTALRKKGCTLQKSKRDGVSCYRIVEAG